MTPLVFGINFLASLAYFDLTGQKPEHPLQQLAENAPLITDAILIGLMSLAAAGFADAQTPQRPPVGGIGSPPDAMIF